MLEASTICARLAQVSRSIRVIIRSLSGGRDSQESFPKPLQILCEILDLVYQLREQVSWAEEKWVVEQSRLESLSELLASFESSISALEFYLQPGGVGIRYFRKHLLERTFMPRLEQYKTILLVVMQPNTQYLPTRVHVVLLFWVPLLTYSVSQGKAPCQTVSVDCHLSKPQSRAW